jgi:phosphomannomutase
VFDFRGLHPHAAEPWVDECERTVVGEGADIGIVLNGDCSRGAVIDANGRLVSPHDVAPLVLEHLVRQRGALGRVVATAASSVRIERQAVRLDCDFTRVPVGFESVYREFADGDVILGTEELGGICHPHHLPERDALESSVMLLEYVAGAGEGVRGLVNSFEAQVGSLEYLARDIRLDFGQTQRLRNLLPGINPPNVLGEVPFAVTHPHGLRVELEDGSWLLVRAATSGAGARVVAEAGDAARVSELINLATTIAHS